MGRDPDDFSAPAMAWDANGNLICQGIAPIARGAYGSVDGAREGARNRKAARDAVAKAAEANDYLDAATFGALLNQLPIPDQGDLPQGTVVGGRFGAPLKAKKAVQTGTKTKSAVTEEMLRNLDRAIGFDRVVGK